MECYGGLSSHFPHNMASPTAQARNYQQSYHQSSAAPNMRYPAHPETTETISALQNRIAVLDTQLAYANKERAAAENATRHLLYIVAAQSGHSVCNRNPTRNTPCSAEAGHALQNSDSTLLDLMDTEDPGLLAISPPELDHSDESTTSEADQDEYLQSFPVIEEGMRQVNTSHAKDGPPLSCKLDHKDMSNEDLVSGDHRGSFPRFEKELLFPLKEVGISNSNCRRPANSHRKFPQSQLARLDHQGYFITILTSQLLLPFRRRR